jgi:hypothetical protein
MFILYFIILLPASSTTCAGIAPDGRRHEMGKREDRKAAKLAEMVGVFVRKRDRTEHPEGSFDYMGRWNPSKKEWCKDCGSVRRPTSAFPLTLNDHCRTAKHVANKHGVNRNELLHAVKALEMKDM